MMELRCWGSSQPLRRTPCAGSYRSAAPAGLQPCRPDVTPGRQRPAIWPVPSPTPSVPPASDTLAAAATPEDWRCAPARCALNAECVPCGSGPRPPGGGRPCRGPVRGTRGAGLMRRPRRAPGPTDRNASRQRQATTRSARRRPRRGSRRIGGGCGADPAGPGLFAPRTSQQTCQITTSQIGFANPAGTPFADLAGDPGFVIRQAPGRAPPARRAAPSLVALRRLAVAGRSRFVRGVAAARWGGSTCGDRWNWGESAVEAPMLAASTKTGCRGWWSLAPGGPAQAGRTKSRPGQLSWTFADEAWKPVCIPSL